MTNSSETRLSELIKTIRDLPLLHIPDGVGLSPPAIGLIAWVSRSPGCGVLDIAKGLHLSAPTISVGIRKLVKDGWLERRDDPKDRRARPLYLTQKAENLIGQVHLHREEMLQIFLSGLNPLEQNQLLDLMEKAVNQMERKLAENNIIE